MTPGPALAFVAPTEDPGVPPDAPLLGLPLARRTALAARRAGFSRIEAVRATPALAAALEGTGAALVDAPSPEAMRLPWNTVVHVRDLKAFAAGTPSVGVAVRSPADLPRAEDSLLKGLVKDEDGFMARHFDRRISLAVSRRLA